MIQRDVFVTGGTGYIGQRLVSRLVANGHRVRALVRHGSEGKLPRGCQPVIGNALDASTFARAVRRGDTFVQLVGTPHPGPAKGAEFRSVDLVSVRESVSAAAAAGVSHFVYISVAHPSRMMRDYIEVRVQGETMIRDAGLRATILRPWYVLGPGHRWPYALMPFYWLMERIPSTRETARRLGLVTLSQMLGTMVWSVENPADGIRILEVPEIRSVGSGQGSLRLVMSS